MNLLAFYEKFGPRVKPGLTQMTSFANFVMSDHLLARVLQSQVRRGNLNKPDRGLELQKIFFSSFTELSNFEWEYFYGHTDGQSDEGLLYLTKTTLE